MTFKATKQPVSNRGKAPDDFLEELVNWAKTAADDIFAPNTQFDIYSKTRMELGPWTDDQHRRAAMLEVMRVLALFESSCDWKEGVDTSKLGEDTPENEEAGAWQVSYDARWQVPDNTLRDLLLNAGVRSGVQFQRAMKFNHPLSMEFVSRLMRYTTRHNGPLYKGEERAKIRLSLRGEEHSIYPWLRRDAVDEFKGLING